MQKDDKGCYSTGIPHGIIDDKAILYYEDYAGNGYYSDINTQREVSYIAENNNVLTSDGVIYNAANKEYSFTTANKNNEYNSVNIQLLDGTKEYIETLLSEMIVGEKSVAFI